MEKKYNLNPNQLAAITAGVGAIGGVGAALAQRQKRQLSEAEQKFGKRPILPGKKRQEWDKKVNNFFNTKSSDATPKDKEKSKVSNKIILIIGGSVLGLAIIGFIVYKLKNTAK